MNTSMTHRFVALALSVVLTLGLFLTIGHHASEDHRHLTLVRMQAEPAANS